MNITLLSKDIKNELDVVEQELEKSVHSNSPILHEASLHLLRAGGKRIRPIFLCLAARFGNSDDRVIDAAVALELIHMASLVHDDVIDQADVRRGRPTIQAKWDRQTAMYTGDFLFAKALEKIATLESLRAHQLLSHTIVEVCLGEIDQVKDRFDFDQNTRRYLRKIKRKTALLLSTSCEMGAIAAKAPLEIQHTFHRFGYFVGMAFQIIDDVLDFQGTEKELGKPAGGDLRQGNITLPVLYALQDASIAPKIRKLHRDSRDDEFQQVITLIKSSNAIKRAQSLADLYIQKAMDELNVLPRIPERDTFTQFTQLITKRKF